jgi:hypothetical protein
MTELVKRESLFSMPDDERRIQFHLVEDPLEGIEELFQEREEREQRLVSIQ